MSEWIIKEDDDGRRVDRIVRSILSHLSLSFIYSSIRKGMIRLNNKKVLPKSLVSVKDVLYIDDVLLQKEKDIAKKYSKKDKKDKKDLKEASLDILLKTPQLLFVNKKMGCSTHGINSVDEMVKKHFPATSDSLSFSVGSLHRLDKNTTGIITFSQSLLGARLFSDYLKNHLIFRYYIGINEGRVKNGTWIAPSDVSDNKLCKIEMTDVWEIEYSKKHDLSLVAYNLITGKKHQIRRSSNFFGKNLFCDSKYGSKRKEYSSYFLHSFALEFSKKIFKEVPHIITSPLPKRFILAIEKYFFASAKKIKECGNIGFLNYILKNIIKKTKF